MKSSMVGYWDLPPSASVNTLIIYLHPHLLKTEIIVSKLISYTKRVLGREKLKMSTTLAGGGDRWWWDRSSDNETSNEMKKIYGFFFICYYLSYHVSQMAPPIDK